MKEKDKKNEFVENVLYIALGLIIAISSNYILGLILRTDLPVVAVVSESMTHDETTEYRHYKYLEGEFGYTREEIDSWPLKNGFRKGDVLVVIGVNTSKLEVGDVIVYDINNQKIPIVHRIVKMNNSKIVTKGDHNPTIDPWEAVYVHGKAVFVIPYLGWPKLIFTYIMSFILSLLF